MPAVYDIFIDFTEEKLTEFLFSDTEQYHSLPFVEPGGDRRGIRDALGMDLSSDEQPQVAYLDTYAIDQNGMSVGQVSITVPFSQPLRITVVYELYVVAGVSWDDGQLLERLFRDYVGDDPTDYIRRNVPAHVSDDQFHIVPRIELEKTGPSVEDKRPRDALIAYWEGKISGVFYLSGAEGIGEWIEQKQYRLTLLSHQQTTTGAAPQIDPYIVAVADVDENQGPHLDRLLASEATTMDCSDISRRREHEVFTILQWPEYMLRPAPVRIKVGCARITFMLPRLHTRTCSNKLYYFYATPQNISPYIQESLEICGRTAIYAGAIIGLVTWNFGAAVVAFKAVFTKCIESRTGQALRCFIPGLIIMQKSTQWRRA